MRDGGTHRPQERGGGDSFGLSLEQTPIPGWCQHAGSTGRMEAEGEAPVSSRVATGEGRTRHCSLRRCHRSPGQEGLQGCLPATCPPWEFENRYRRSGRRNGLREGSEWGGIPKIPPDKSQRQRTCLVPSQEEPGESNVLLGHSKQTHLQPAVLPSCDHSAPRDEPGGGCISCISSSTPGSPARGLGPQHLCGAVVCGGTSNGFTCRASRCQATAPQAKSTAAAVSWQGGWVGKPWGSTHTPVSLFLRNTGMMTCFQPQSLF